VAAFEAVYGRAPGFIEAIAYDSARIMLNAMLDPNVWLRAGIRHTLMKAVPVEGVTGKVTFDGTGEPVKDLVLLQIEGSGFIEIDPSRAPIKGLSDDIPPAPLP
jgi:ABC-type branched-subunit amino acid transport system substrate-binding protein